MAQYLERLEVKLMAGVGAAFDLHAGLRSDAPHWMKQCGLQWLHRLHQEPRRLGPRYLQTQSAICVGNLWAIGGVEGLPLGRMTHVIVSCEIQEFLDPYGGSFFIARCTKSCDGGHRAYCWRQMLQLRYNGASTLAVARSAGLYGKGICGDRPW